MVVARASEIEGKWKFAANGPPINAREKATEKTSTSLSPELLLNGFKQNPER